MFKKNKDVTIKVKYIDINTTIANAIIIGTLAYTIVKLQERIHELNKEIAELKEE